MSIEKKSLINTLKTTKKANVAKDVKGEKVGSMRLISARANVSMKKTYSQKSFKAVD